MMTHKFVANLKTKYLKAFAQQPEKVILGSLDKPNKKKITGEGPQQLAL